MGTSSFKSKVQKYARNQAFILGKISSGFRGFKSSKTVLGLQDSQPTVKTDFEKRRSGRIYQFALIAIAAAIFSSCQKEVNTPPPAPSTASIAAGDTASATTAR